MTQIPFESLSLWVNSLIFFAAAASVFAAGTKLAGRADIIATSTGLNQAFLGASLLGVATLLPECRGSP